PCVGTSSTWAPVMASSMRRWWSGGKRGIRGRGRRRRGFCGNGGGCWMGVLRFSRGRIGGGGRGVFGRLGSRLRREPAWGRRDVGPKMIGVLFGEGHGHGRRPYRYCLY